MKYMVDHQEIKQWAEANKAKPQLINDPNSTGDTEGLRLDFPGNADEDSMLEVGMLKKDVSWEEFFIKFEEDNLAIALDEHSNSTNPSNRYHFIKRDVIDKI